MAGGPRGRRQESGLEAGHRIEISAATWHAVEELSRETGLSLNDLAEEAFCDLLKKHRRPRSLREALRESARQHPANDCAPLDARCS